MAKAHIVHVLLILTQVTDLQLLLLLLPYLDTVMGSVGDPLLHLTHLM